MSNEAVGRFERLSTSARWVRLIGEGLTLPAAIARVATAGPAALPAGEGETLLYAG